MAEKLFNLDIVTPTKKIYSGLVESFSAPGLLGGFQVLFDHAPLLSSIGLGEVKVIEKGGKETRYATTGGFVEVNNNSVIMVAETAERSDEIDQVRAQEAKKRAFDRLVHKEAVDEIRARASLTRAMNRLKVVGKS